VGIGNYAIVSGFGTYSHSTYAEAISCTGILGSLLYFCGYIIIGYKLVSKFFHSHDAYAKARAFSYIGFFIVLIFLGIGVIHFDSLTSTFAFGLLIIYVNNGKEKISFNKKAYTSPPLLSKD
jgi:O-antigen ligase